MPSYIDRDLCTVAEHQIAAQRHADRSFVKVRTDNNQKSNKWSTRRTTVAVWSTRILCQLVHRWLGTIMQTFGARNSVRKFRQNRPQLLGAGVLVFHDSSRAHIAPAASGKHCFSPLIVLTGVLISIPSEGWKNRSLTNDFTACGASRCDEVLEKWPLITILIIYLFYCATCFGSWRS